MKKILSPNKAYVHFSAITFMLHYLHQFSAGVQKRDYFGAICIICGLNLALEFKKNMP